MNWSMNLFTNSALAATKNNYIYTTVNNLNFLIVATFNESSSPSSTTLTNVIINNTNNTNTLQFTKNGSLFLNGEYLFQNPLTQSENPDSTIPSVNITQYSPWNSYHQTPNFILSNGDGKWILCDDTEKSGNFYLLYNPINTQQFTWNNNTFGDYCEAIQYQDPGCYCANYPGKPKKCSYAVFPSESDAIPFVDTIQTEAQNVSAQQNLNNTCGCNSICQQYLKNSNNSPVHSQPVTECNKTMVSTFCNAGAIAQTGGQVSANGLRITQNCGNDNTYPAVPTSTIPPPSDGGSSPSGSVGGNVKYPYVVKKKSNTAIIIIIILVIIIIIGILLFFKKV